MQQVKVASRGRGGRRSRFGCSRIRTHAGPAAGSAVRARAYTRRARLDRACGHSAALSAKFEDVEIPVELRPGEMPIYVTLPHDVISSAGVLTYALALESGLRALKCIGVDGVVVEVWWGVVEGRRPQQYDWIGYCHLFQILAEVGLQARVVMCFHANSTISLPPWVLDVGQQNPDIFFADRMNNHNLGCLSLGIDELPLLHGRSSIECYKDLMRSFHVLFHPLYGTLIKEICVGMGPDAELRYPSNPPERWNYPGIGEFQCYDRYMLSVLQACALQLERPEYGRDGGPHDAGTYCNWPHQTKFFRRCLQRCFLRWSAARSDDGSWKSDYGTFFLEWYSQNLIAHANRVLEVTHNVFGDHDVTLYAKLPAIHWWQHSASHAAELTAGINHTSVHEGYMPIIRALKQWDCNVLISACEMCTRDESRAAASDPEELVLYVRTCASAQHLKVGLENTEIRFDEAAFSQMEEQCFDRHTAKNMQLSYVAVFTFNRMGDLMFEPFNWHRFKAFIVRLKERLREIHRLPYEETMNGL